MLTPLSESKDTNECRISRGVQSSGVTLGTFFNAGVRAYDVSDPYAPREIAYFVPPAPENAKTGQIQLNDVFVDDRGIVFTVDRGGGGLYALEMKV